MATGCDTILKWVTNGVATFDTNSNDRKTLIVLMTDVKLQDVLTERPQSMLPDPNCIQTPHATCTGATMQPHNRSHTGFKGEGGIKHFISLLI